MNPTTPATNFNPHQILQMKSEMVAQRYTDFLKSTPFPQERLSTSWKSLAILAIEKLSPLSLKISLKEYRDVLSADINNLSFFEMGCLSNAIEVISLHDAAGFTRLEYMHVINEVISHIDFYQSEMKNVVKRIETEVEKEVSMKVATERQKQNGLAPVKGEA